MTDLDLLRGKHAGKSALVVGAGPSARLTPKDVASRHIVLAVNEAISLFPNPDYFCARDRTILPEHDYWPTILRSGCIYALFDAVEGMPLHHFDEERTVIMTMKPSWMMNPCDDQIICGYSAQCAVHFAVILGCSPIYLTGCDCRYVDGKRRFSQFANGKQDESRAAESTRQIESSFGKKKTAPEDGVESDYFLDSILSAWKFIKSRNPSVEIIDASAGRLEGVFESVDIGEL